MSPNVTLPVLVGGEHGGSRAPRTTERHIVLPADDGDTFPARTVHYTRRWLAGPVGKAGPCLAYYADVAMSDAAASSAAWVALLGMAGDLP